jgi:flagellar biosynthesis/type III secretory pathway M-ring protein FliF/YscJ
VAVLVIIVLIAVVAVAVFMLRTRRGPRQDEGMQSFRRHIDALSPEARREVIDRARKHDEDRN